MPTCNSPMTVDIAEKQQDRPNFDAFSPFSIVPLTNFHFAEMAKFSDINISNPQQDSKPSNTSPPL